MRIYPIVTCVYTLLQVSSQIARYITLFSKRGIEFQESINPNPISGNTGSPSTWSLIQAWIATCTEDHSCCTGAADSLTRLPTRVLDVQSEESPRLVITHSSMEPDRYTTLSHCWGSGMPLRLLTNNIDEFQTGISPSQLCKTFNDAIIVTRKLGIRYLWIDSLCIIQDSPQDWQEQSATMAQVYTNSYCNIAATHAADGSFGCFTERDADLLKPLKVDLQFGPRPGPCHAVPGRYWAESVMEMPLFLRAWAFQELILAPRRIFFGQTEVSFQCKQNAASETFPGRVPRQVGAGGLVQIEPNSQGGQFRQFYGSSAEETLHTLSKWDTIVYRFSIGRLTFATDKLVALSAIASKMSERLKCGYLAGLWHQHLAYQLLWEVRGEVGIADQYRTSTYVAPTWSWASVTGRVWAACKVRHADGRDIVVEIIEAQVELVSELSPFGQVKNGFIRVKGPLVKGRKFRNIHVRTSDSSRILIGDDITLDVIWDNGEEENSNGILEGFYCLPIQLVKDHEPTPSLMAVPPISGIVLRLTSPQGQEYVRVGKFVAYGGYERFQAACRNFGDAANSSEGCDEGWGKMHTLTIV